MIRRLEEQDIDCVMKLWLASNIQVHSFIPEEYWRDNYESVKLALPQAEVYLYEADNRILGFIGLSGDYIEGIFVEEAVRSCGIGKKLLDYVKQMKCSLCLRVYAENERAVRFYKREGFEIQKEGEEERTGAIEFRMIWKTKDRNHESERKESEINFCVIGNFTSGTGGNSSISSD